MGLSASQCRLLLLTAKRSDIEYRAQQISQQRLVIAQELEQVALEYEKATSNRQMKISLAYDGQGQNDVVSKSVNLTYAALVSGTVSKGIGGIKGYDRTQGQEYASMTPYRLVDSDGAIVVSSEEEIPTDLTVENEVATQADSASGGVYRPYTQNSNGEKEYKQGYYVARQGALATFLDQKGNEGISVSKLQVDLKNGVVQITDTTGKAHYFSTVDGSSIADGDARISGGFKASDGVSADVVKTNEIPKSTVQSTSVATVQKGADNKYTLKDANGTVVARYIVDESLKYGTTDSSGSTDGPNYLQDCLREGKYLLSKGMQDPDTKEWKWKELSWDSATNITDSYYTDDDERAKAQYDRKQSELQNLDKKLEIEQDNNEAQRSAVTTEIESVTKVRDDDIKDSFNTFA